MKTTMVFALGLAALVATPAFAQKPTHHVNTNGNNGPYASAVHPAPVTSSGYNVGTDPDPSIRFELSRDSATYSSTNE